jgi:flagellar motor switch protein FliM
MQREPLEHPALFLGGGDVGPTKRAAETLDRHAPSLVTAMKKAVPFLSRRGVPVEAMPSTPLSVAELEQQLGEPSYVMHAATDPGGVRAAVAFDPRAISFLLCGALGDDGSDPPPLTGRLTTAQTMLMQRTGQAVIAALSNALGAALGLRLQPLPSGGDGAPEGRSVALWIHLGEDGKSGRIAVLLAKDALLGLVVSATRGSAVDPRAAAALERVELTLIAELGRVRMKLGELAALKVGDMVHLDATLGGTLDVRAEEQVLLKGQPTSSGTHVAIRVV